VLPALLTTFFDLWYKGHVLHRRQAGTALYFDEYKLAVLKKLTKTKIAEKGAQRGFSGRLEAVSGRLWPKVRSTPPNPSIHNPVLF
jgi:hypothetical protein